MATEMDKLAEAYYEKVRRTETWSGIPLKPIYTPQDTAGIDYEREIADAGQYPFTRGIHADMYRGKLWTRRQGWGYGLGEDTNKQLRLLMQQGNTGFSIYRDLPSANGIDSDHPLAEGEVGVAGVALCSMQDMEAIMEGLPLDQVTTSLLCGSVVAPIMLAQYIAVADKTGIPRTKLRGQVSSDTLMGHFCYSKDTNPLDLCVKAAVDVIEFCTKEMPQWNATDISACYNLREAAALTAPQEIAIGFGHALAYMRGAMARGLSIDDIAPRANFYCNVGIDFFEEIAKFRAMRRLWAKLMREKFGAKDPRSWRFRMAVQTSGASLTKQQPLNNIVRAAFETLASVLGGAQSIYCTPYEETVCLPTELGHEVALRTQQIIAYETGVAAVADPLGGSYYVETLTNQIEEEAAKLLEQVEAMGGIVEAIRVGWVDRLFDQQLARYQKEVESGQRTVVGLNAFARPPREGDFPGGILRIPPQVETEQIARVKRLKAARDSSRVREAITNLRRTAEKGREVNLMPAVIDAVKVYATIEEIQGTIREAFGYTWDPMGMRKSPF